MTIAPACLLRGYLRPVLSADAAVCFHMAQAVCRSFDSGLYPDPPCQSGILSPVCRSQRGNGDRNAEDRLFQRLFSAMADHDVRDGALPYSGQAFPAHADASAQRRCLYGRADHRISAAFLPEPENRAPRRGLDPAQGIRPFSYGALYHHRPLSDRGHGRNLL